MALPKAVQDAADRADEIQKQIAGIPQEEAQVSPEPAEEVESTETEAENTATQEPTEPSNPEGDKWEAKYRTLQGMYNAEVPRMKKQNEELEAKLNAYATQVKELREAIAQQEVGKKYITDEDSEVFGADVVDLARRAAKQEATQYSQEAAGLKNDVEEMKAELNQLRGVSYQNTLQQYQGRLTALVPGWEKQNSDQAFIDWLSERDPFAGGLRKQALDEAYQALDAQRTADIFLAYRQATGAYSDKPRETKAEKELRRQVTPSGRASTVEPSGATKRVYTQADIQRFYEAVRRHELTSEEATAMEREIDQAVAEGRVRM